MRHGGIGRGIMYPPCSAEPLQSPLIGSQGKQSEGDRVEAGLGAENLQSLFRSPTLFRLIHGVPHKVSFEERVQQLKKKKKEGSRTTVCQASTNSQKLSG